MPRRPGQKKQILFDDAPPRRKEPSREAAQPKQLASVGGHDGRAADPKVGGERRARKGSRAPAGEAPRVDRGEPDRADVQRAPVPGVSPAAGVAPALPESRPAAGGAWTPLTRAEYHSPVTHEEIVKWCRENSGKRIHYRAIRRFCNHGAASPNAVKKAIEEVTA